MSSASFGVDFAIMKWISCDVRFIVKQPVDAEMKVMSVDPRISLAVQNKLHDSGTNIGVEKC